MAKKNKKRSKKNKATFNSANPKVFFKNIGIKPLVKPYEEGSIDIVEQEVLRRCGSNAINQVEGIYDDFESNNAFNVYHSNLSLVKIWYGASFYRLCRIATQLSEVSIPPKSKILDIGGGPGHFAFWMANIWNVSNIMVTDRFPEVGTQWATNIKEYRVKFINSTLPELNEISDGKFDVVVLSRVLSFMPELNLPYTAMDLTAASYLQSEEGHQVYNKLIRIGDRLNEIVETDGKIIVVDSWSDLRVLLVGKAFEHSGLYINIQDFNTDKVGAEPSVIVFTKSINPMPVKDLPHSLATALYFPDEPPVFLGTAACSIRNLFKDGEIKDQFEFESNTKKLKRYHEIVEKEGLLLVYVAENDGIINAWIYPSIFVLNLLRDFEELKKKLTGGVSANIPLKPEAFDQLKMIAEEQCRVCD